MTSMNLGMKRYHDKPFANWLIGAVVCSAIVSCVTGCGTWNGRRRALQPSPVLFKTAPTLESIVRAVNENTARVQTLQSDRASIRLRGLPALTAKVRFEAPRNFRLQASAPIVGPELDLGSNPELFWFWAKRSPNPALVFARHEDFARASTRAAAPIEPEWILDAIGLMSFREGDRHEGPAVVGNLLEVRSYLPSPTGTRLRIARIHQKQGYIVEQYLYEPSGQLIAASRAKDHNYLAAEQVTIPEKISIDVPAFDLAAEIELAEPIVNAMIGNSSLLFALPQQEFSQYPLVDLTDPRMLSATSGPQGSVGQQGPAVLVNDRAFSNEDYPEQWISPDRENRRIERGR